ncbi:hypothetical protein [Haloglycomyces albus]|uniref:hypothetical protein n=1 Tax=Haloglycomyces albus TaxID=526067 RepID=UPI00046D3A1B|nr:hypothetical protein [Haloglycomyces albus]
MRNSYVSAVSDYLELDGVTQEEATTLHDEYERDRTRVENRIHQAQQREQAARRDLAEAEELQDDLDRRTTRLWDRLAALVGPGTTGDFPQAVHRFNAPSSEPTRLRADLADLERLVATAKRGELPFEPPVMSSIVAGVIGLCCGSAGVYGALALLGIDSSSPMWNALQPAAATVCVLASAGVAPIAWGMWQAAWYRVRPRPQGVLLAVSLAAVAIVVGSVLFLRGY